ncbi:MAG: hypothetical protein AAF844_14935, partial [Pseudomonadota bacterium]
MAADIRFPMHPAAGLKPWASGFTSPPGQGSHRAADRRPFGFLGVLMGSLLTILLALLDIAFWIIIIQAVLSWLIA